MAVTPAAAAALPTKARRPPPLPDSSAPGQAPAPPAADDAQFAADIRDDVVGSGAMCEGPWGPRMATYMDYAASGRLLHSFEAYMASNVHPLYANTHTEDTCFGRKMAELVQASRDQVAAAVGASSVDYAIVFLGSGSTAAINRIGGLLLRSAALAAVPVPPAVFVGPFEHHSNLLLWREANCELVMIPEDASGRIDQHKLEAEVARRREDCPGRMLIGSFSAGSNVTGILETKVDDLAVIMHAYGGLAFFDYAAAGSYCKIEMQPPSHPLAYKDGVYLSPHKFLGGPGSCGVLVARRALFDPSLPPMQPGGGTVDLVTPSSHCYHEDAESREEGGTPNILGAVRCGLAFALLREALRKPHLHELEATLLTRATQGLSGIPGVILLGSEKPAFQEERARTGILSFLVVAPPEVTGGRAAVLHHHFVTKLLGDLYGIQTRSGCSCAATYGIRLLAALPVFRSLTLEAPAPSAADAADAADADLLPDPDPDAVSIVDDDGDSPHDSAASGRLRDGGPKPGLGGPGSAAGEDTAEDGEDRLRAGVSVMAGFLEAAVRSGDRSMKLGWTRASIKYVNTEEEVDYLVEAVRQVAEHGWRLLPLYELDPGSGRWELRSAAARQQQQLRRRESPRHEPPSPCLPPHRSALCCGLFGSGAASRRGCKPGPAGSGACSRVPKSGEPAVTAAGRSALNARPAGAVSRLRATLGGLREEPRPADVEASGGARERERQRYLAEAQDIYRNAAHWAREMQQQQQQQQQQAIPPARERPPWWLQSSEAAAHLAHW